MACAANPAPIDVASLHTARERYSRGVLTGSTLGSYAFDWALFRGWCEQIGQGYLPAEPDTLGLYLTYVMEVERKKITTAARRCCAIHHYHVTAGYPSPYTEEVRRVLRGARRIRCERPRQMRPRRAELFRMNAAGMIGL
jgi:hypothetical protein